jgi:hypothetical protein
MISRSAQRRADNWAGTPMPHYLADWLGFASAQICPAEGVAAELDHVAIGIVNVELAAGETPAPVLA